MDNNYNQQTNENTNQQGNPYQQPAPNIFQQFCLSFVPPQYNRLAKVKTGSMIGFVTLLSFISSVIIFAFLLILFKSLNLREYIDQMPNFEIREGRLTVEEDFIYDEAPIYLYITDDVNAFSYEDTAKLADEGYWGIYLIGRDSLSIMQYTITQINPQYSQIDFSDIESGIVIDKDWIVDASILLMRVSFVMGFFIFFVGSVFWYFLCAAVYLLFAMLIASVMKKQLSTGTLFRVAVYSKVLMFVAATFFSVFFLADASMLFLLRVTITVVFMGFAIAKLPEEGWR